MRAFGALPPAARAVVTVGATSLFMVLVAWATLIGPDAVFTGPGPRPATLTTTAESCTPTPSESGTTNQVVHLSEDSTGPDEGDCEDPDAARGDAEDLGEQADPPLWLKLLVWTLQVLLLGAIIALLTYLGALAIRSLRLRRRSREDREAVEFTTLDEPSRVAEEIAADAGEQDALLRDGEPRNAIVAAWHRFEVQGERAGVGRRPSETSSEYAIRILDLVAADSGAVARLAGLYREARFSDHAITEDHRDRALEALAVIRRSLGART